MNKKLSVRRLRHQRNIQSFVVFLVGILVVTCMTKFFGASFIYSAITAGLFILLILGLQSSKPGLVVPRKAHGELDRDQKNMHRQLRKNWVRIANESQLSREDADEVFVPQIVEVKPHALGLELLVQPISGQPVQELLDKSGSIASAAGVEVRAKKINSSKVQYIFEFRDALEGIRNAGISDTPSIVIGRQDDGDDAVIDFEDASHVIMQGMTRSGKSALCYTIFSQLYGQKNISLWGIDPNQVLLSPLSEALGPERFVLGNNPVEALGLMKKFVGVMDQNLSLLTIRRVEALREFTEETPLQILILEEFPGLLRQAELYDKGVSTKERIAPEFRTLLGRLVSEGAKAGVRVVLLAQRADASIIDGNTRGQFATRITMGVDNADAVRMLHPNASPETVEEITGEDCPPGRCIFWSHRKQRMMQADYTPYADYLQRLGVLSELEITGGNNG